MFRSNAIAIFLTGSILATAACSNGTVSPGSSEINPASAGISQSGIGRQSQSGKIQHIVIVIQEARSFDNLFCGFAGADGKCQNQTIPLEANCTISDTFGDYQRDRKTGNFGKEHANCPGYQQPEYAHVPSSELTPYYEIAQQYVLGDEMFSSTGNPTFEAHQYAIAAQSDSAKDQPFGKSSDGCVYQQLVRQFGGGKTDACFTYKTMADLLSEAGLTWSYYRTGARRNPVVNTWDAFGWIKGGSSGISPSSTFLSDVCAGKLATVTWITPAFADSDLSGSLSSSGPRWVASVINAVGESQFWGSTAVVVLWSGFGGWYDHVAPPNVDRNGLGFRVPVLVVSPYALSGSVVHERYETASVLRFVEDTFGLGQLAASDTRAQSIGTASLNLKQKPRAFEPIPDGSGCSRR